MNITSERLGCRVAHHLIGQDAAWDGCWCGEARPAELPRGGVQVEGAPVQAGHLTPQRVQLPLAPRQHLHILTFPSCTAHALDSPSSMPLKVAGRVSSCTPMTGHFTSCGQVLKQP